MGRSRSPEMLERLARQGFDRLHAEDGELYELLEREHRRQGETLQLIAACSMAESSVLVCQSTATNNVTTEGYPGARFHGGCAVVDEIERLAIDRAKMAFGAKYANVQPHSGTTANQTIMCALLKPGDVVLGMNLDAGG